MSRGGVRASPLAPRDGGTENRTSCPIPVPVPAATLEPFAWLAKAERGHVLLYLIPRELFGVYLPPLFLFLVHVEGPESRLYTRLWRAQLHALGVHAACHSN